MANEKTPQQQIEEAYAKLKAELLALESRIQKGEQLAHNEYERVGHLQSTLAVLDRPAAASVIGGTTTAANPVRNAQVSQVEAPRESAGARPAQYRYTVKGDDKSTTDYREYDTVETIATALLNSNKGANGLLTADAMRAIQPNEGAFANHLKANFPRLAASGFDTATEQRQLLEAWVIYTNNLKTRDGKDCTEKTKPYLHIREGQELILPWEVSHVEQVRHKIIPCPQPETPPVTIIPPPPAPEMVSQLEVVPAQRVGVVQTRLYGQYSIDAANYFLGKPPTDPTAYGNSPLALWEGSRAITYIQLARSLTAKRGIDTTLTGQELPLKPERVAFAEVTPDGNVIPTDVNPDKKKRFKYETGSAQTLMIEADGTTIPVAVGLMSGATISQARKEGGHNYWTDAPAARADFGKLLDTPDGIMHYTSYTVVDNEKQYLHTKYNEATARFAQSGNPQDRDAMAGYADAFMQMQVRQLANPAVWSLRPYDGIETQSDIIHQMRDFVQAAEPSVRAQLEQRYMNLPLMIPSQLVNEARPVLTHSPVARQIEERIQLDFIHDKNAYGLKQEGNRQERQQRQVEEARRYGQDAWRAIELQSFRAPSQVEHEVGAAVLSTSASRAAFQSRPDALTTHLNAERRADTPASAQPQNLGALRDWVGGVGKSPEAMDALLRAAIAERPDGSAKHPAAVDALLQTVWISTRDDGMLRNIHGGLSPLDAGPGTRGYKEFGFTNDHQADNRAKEMERLLGDRMKGDLRYRDPNLARDTFAGVVKLLSFGSYSMKAGENSNDVKTEDALPELRRMAEQDPAKFREVAARFGDYMQRAAASQTSAQFAANIATGLSRRVGEDGTTLSPEMRAFYLAANQATNMYTSNVTDTTLMINNRNWEGLEQGLESKIIRGEVGAVTRSTNEVREQIQAGGVRQVERELKPGESPATIDRIVYVTTANVENAHKAVERQRELAAGRDLSTLRGAELAAALQNNLNVYATLDNPSKWTPSENNAGFAGFINRSQPTLLAVQAIQIMAGERQGLGGQDREISQIINGFARTGRKGDGAFENMLQDQAKALRAGRTDVAGVIAAVNAHVQDPKNNENGKDAGKLLAYLNEELMAVPKFNDALVAGMSTRNGLLASQGVRSGIAADGTLLAGNNAAGSGALLAGNNAANSGALLAGNQTIAGVISTLDDRQQALLAGLLSNPEAMRALASRNFEGINQLLAGMGASWQDTFVILYTCYKICDRDKPPEKEPECPPGQTPGENGECAPPPVTPPPVTPPPVTPPPVTPPPVTPPPVTPPPVTPPPVTPPPVTPPPVTPPPVTPPPVTPPPVTPPPVTPPPVTPPPVTPPPVTPPPVTPPPVTPPPVTPPPVTPPPVTPPPVTPPPVTPPPVTPPPVTPPPVTPPPVTPPPVTPPPVTPPPVTPPPVTPPPVTPPPVTPPPVTPPPVNPPPVVPPVTPIDCTKPENQGNPACQTGLNGISKSIQVDSKYAGTLSVPSLDRDLAIAQSYSQQYPHTIPLAAVAIMAEEPRMFGDRQVTKLVNGFASSDLPGGKEFATMLKEQADGVRNGTITLDQAQAGILGYLSSPERNEQREGLMQKLQSDMLSTPKFNATLRTKFDTAQREVELQHQLEQVKPPEAYFQGAQIDPLLKERLRSLNMSDQQMVAGSFSLNTPQTPNGKPVDAPEANPNRPVGNGDKGLA